MKYSLLALAAMLVCVLAMPTAPVVANNRIPEVTETDVRVLSQMCIGEAGWRGGETGECDAIIHVALWLQQHRMRGWRLQTVARVYSAVFKTRYRPWIMELNLQNTQPSRWPAASWEMRQPLWESTVRSVRETLDGTRENPCMHARDWGSVDDGAPSPRSVQIQCSRDFNYEGRRLPPNRFWTIPSALPQASETPQTTSPTPEGESGPESGGEEAREADLEEIS